MESETTTMAAVAAAIGCLWGSLVVVVKAMKGQYEHRIAVLEERVKLTEKRADQCEVDRINLTAQISDIWKNLAFNGHKIQDIDGEPTVTA